MADLKIDIYSLLTFSIMVVTLTTVVSIEKEQKAALAIAWADVVTTDKLIMKIIAHGYAFAILLLIVPVALIAFTQRTKPQQTTNKEINHD